MERDDIVQLLNGSYAIIQNTNPKILADETVELYYDIHDGSKEILDVHEDDILRLVINGYMQKEDIVKVLIGKLNVKS